MLILAYAVLASQYTPHNPVIVRHCDALRVAGDAQRNAAIDRLMAEVDAKHVETDALQKWCSAGNRLRKATTVEERAVARAAKDAAAVALRAAEAEVARVVAANKRAVEAEAVKQRQDEQNAAAAKAEAELEAAAKQKAEEAAKRREDK